MPLAEHIDEVLGEREGHRAPRERFELELEDHLDPRSADQALRVVIDWGRYAGLLDYDDHTRTFGRCPLGLHVGRVLDRHQASHGRACDAG